MNLARIVLIAAVCLADGVLLLRAAPAMAAEIISDVAPPPGSMISGSRWATHGATCKGIGSARILGTQLVESSALFSPGYCREVPTLV